MKEDITYIQEIEKFKQQPMYFSLAQDNKKCLHSCSKCGLGCPQKFVPQFPPLQFCVTGSRLAVYTTCIFDCATGSRLADVSRPSSYVENEIAIEVFTWSSVTTIIFRFLYIVRA